MAYQQFAEKFKDFLSNWSKAVTGNGTSQTFDYIINPAQELNGLRNATTLNDMVQLSNGYYDQIAINRSLKELSKNPKDYFNEFVADNEYVLNQVNNLNVEIKNSEINIINTMTRNKSIKSLSKTLQLKLSLIGK